LLPYYLIYFVSLYYFIVFLILLIFITSVVIVLQESRAIAGKPRMPCRLDNASPKIPGLSSKKVWGQKHAKFLHELEIDPRLLAHTPKWEEGHPKNF